MAVSTAKTSAAANPMEREVIITRVFNAPRELVFKAFTEREHLIKWWGPGMFTNPVCEVDLRVGGAWRIIMRGPDGTDYPCGGVYREIIEPERLVFTNNATDAQGNRLLDGLTEVTFSNVGGRTKLTLKTRAIGLVPFAPQMLAGMEAGWSQSLDKLEQLVASSSPTADREIVTTRIFDAPRDLVYEAWTDPKHLAQWWGPNGFSSTIQEMDVRPNGKWRLIMHGPDGTDYKNESVYLEVVKPELLSYEHSSTPKFRSTVTFEEQGRRTKVTMFMVFDTAQERETTVKVFGAIEGAKQTFSRLSEFLSQGSGNKQSTLRVTLPSDLEILMTRVFNAPRSLVFEALSKPEHVARWWGPRNTSLSVCEIDFRVGGAWRYVLQTPNGPSPAFKGVFLEITPPHRIVSTEIFDEPKFGSPEWTTTVTLEEHEGKTTLTSRVLHKSVENRNGHLNSGMEPGATETFDRLAELLESWGQ
jgi:uncharacterized protein YndB with AHSA1/START domain